MHMEADFSVDGGDRPSGPLQRRHVLLADGEVVGRPVVSLPHRLPHEQPHGLGVVLQRQSKSRWFNGQQQRGSITRRKETNFGQVGIHGDFQTHRAVQGEAVVDASGQRDQVSFAHRDPDPAVLLVPHVKVSASIQDVADLIIRVEMLLVEHPQLRQNSNRSAPHVTSEGVMYTQRGAWLPSPHSWVTCPRES